MVLRYNVAWSIPNAGPCVSVWHIAGQITSDIDAVNGALRTFYAAQAARLPDNVSVSFPTEVLEIDDASGELIGTAALANQPVVTGTATAGWGAGLGARVVWGTNAIRFGRRVRGSLFLVPLANTSFDTNGRVADATRTAIVTAAQNLMTTLGTLSKSLVVYSRPTAKHPIGASSNVVAPSVSAVPGTLRGRKY